MSQPESSHFIPQESFKKLTHEDALFFENFDFRDKKQWMAENWTLSIAITAIYLGFIFIGQLLMRNRTPYDLRKLLTSWNVLLALFSIAATMRTLPELIRILLQNHGFHHSACSPCEDVSPASAFWAWAFVLSKVVELMDTVFIVLRKQPLIFLHWYHHLTVLLYSWYSYGDYIAPARWFVVMNYLVHSFMYTYYALKSLRWRIPRIISMSLTFLQLSQMVIGFWVNMYAYTVKNEGLECDISYHHLQIGFGIYASYFALFLNFFYNAYFGGKRKQALNKKPSPVGIQKNSTANGHANGHGYGLRNRVGTNA